MTPWRRSIRTRVAAALALTAIVSVCAIGSVVDRNTTLAGRERLRTQALADLAVATAAYDFTGTAPADATTLPGMAPRGMALRAKPGTAVTWYDGHTMWAARRVDGRLLSLRQSGAELAATRGSLRRTLLLAGLLIVVLATLAGWFVAGTLTLRLRRAAADVERTRATTPGLAPAVEPPGGDEVTELVARIQQLSVSLLARLDRERAFSADVAHELRTPITGLVSATELLAEGEASALVRRQTRRLRRLVEDLLELARAERSDTTSVVRLSDHDLGELVEQVVADHPDAELDLGVRTRVRTDPRCFDRVLANLVVNAVRHGAPPICVHVEDRTVTVVDNGPGFPESLVADGPRRFATHGSTAGAGLGLAIASAWAERIGAALELANTPEGGARAVLRLPAT